MTVSVTTWPPSLPPSTAAEATTSPRRPERPIYIPSRGRADRCLTAKLLDSEGIPFWLVVEPQELEAYVGVYGPERVLAMDREGGGSVTYARNWIKDYATRSGQPLHWQVDDNIRGVRLLEHETGKSVKARIGNAMVETEEFVSRFDNVPIAGIRHAGFVEKGSDYFLNRQVYCCVLVDDRFPFRWRPKLGQDTDFSLQVLSAGFCTVLVNKYSIEKASSGTMKGGTTETYKDDGRIRRARGLERLWPGLVRVERRWGRPVQNLTGVWRKFRTRLHPREETNDVA